MAVAAEEAVVAVAELYLPRFDRPIKLWRGGHFYVSLFRK